MDKIKGAGHVNNLFVAEDVQTLRPPTEITVDWLNDVQEEICNAVLGLGLSLKAGDQSQLFKAISAALEERTSALNTHESDLAAHVGQAPHGLGWLHARMKAGDRVGIAFFGDSTTDGNSTTDWTGNPVAGGGLAIGTTNHGLSGGINAYPAKLQALLRLFYKNNQIYCYNAGYSGKRLDNGWAHANIDAAIINNPYYSDCDAIVVAFGLNDAAVTGSRLAEHQAETERLVKKIISEGKLPILMSSDAHWRSYDEFDGIGGSVYENSEIFELNAMKQSLAVKYRIPYLDMHDGQRDWMNRNGGVTWWSKTQPDGLHSNDEGHRIKAAILARQLIPDLYRVSRSAVERIEWHDARCRYPYAHDTDFAYTVSDAAIQNNFNVTPNNYVAGGAVLDAWVWCDDSNLPLIYRAVAAGGQPHTVAVADLAKIRVFHMVDEVTPEIDIKMPGAGLSPYFNWVFDRPCRLGTLKYGLNRIVMMAPNVADTGMNFIGGYFEINPSWLMPLKKPYFYGDAAADGLVTFPRWQLDALSHSGPLSFSLQTGGVPENDRAVFGMREFFDGSNCVDFGQILSHKQVYIKGTMTSNSGPVLLSGPSYRNAGSIITNEGSLFLYRPSAVAATIRLYVYGDEGSLLQLGEGTFASNYPGNAFEVVIAMKRLADGTQEIKVYEGASASGSPVISWNSAASSAAPSAGTVGGAMFYRGTANQLSKVEINTLRVMEFN